MHRPSGLAVGPDGSLYVSDDIRGRIYRIVYQGGSRRSPATDTPCPSASAPAGKIVEAACQAAGRHESGCCAASCLPKEQRRRWLRWVIASITVKWAERPARVAMARTARVHPWVPTLRARNGCGAMAVLPESEVDHRRRTETQDNIAARCRLWVGHNSRQTRSRRWPHMCGP